VKAYLIDPFDMTVSPVLQVGDDPGAIKSHIRAARLDAVFVAVVGDVRLTLYVDDEGIYQQPQAWFRFAGFGEPIPGRALCVGTDARGGMVEPPWSMARVFGSVSWLGCERPKLADIEVRRPDGSVRHVPMNGPDAPKSAIEAALKIAEAQGDARFAAFIREQMREGTR
jgi:hypothetical protein